MFQFNKKSDHFDQKFIKNVVLSDSGLNWNSILLLESKSALNWHLIPSTFDLELLLILFLGPNRLILVQGNREQFFF